MKVFLNFKLIFLMVTDGIIIISWGKIRLMFQKSYKTWLQFLLLVYFTQFLKIIYSVSSNFPILNSRNKFYKIQLKKCLLETNPASKHHPPFIPLLQNLPSKKALILCKGSLFFSAIIEVIAQFFVFLVN